MNHSAKAASSGNTAAVTGGTESTTPVAEVASVPRAPRRAAVAKATGRKAVTPKHKAKPTAKAARVESATPAQATLPTGVAAEAGKKGERKIRQAKKPKVVRDSFTFPESEYALLAALKQRVLQVGREVKKSELLRAGLAALAAMPERDLLAAVDAVERIRTGRPPRK